MASAGYELLKAKKYDPLIAELVKRIGMEETATCWLHAESWLDLLIKDLPSLPEAERMHVEKHIMPLCAVYFAMRAKFGQEEAYQLLSDFMRHDAEQQAARVGRFISIPGARRVVMLVASLVVPKLFGESAGFESTLIESNSRRLRMDVSSCTYERWCEICGAKEIAPLFCDSDDYAYGSIEGLKFRREGTLARGADHCDFDFELR